jgi:hypothetical protein
MSYIKEAVVLFPLLPVTPITLLPKDLTSEKNITLLDLNPVEFEYKADYNKKKHYGFIAQEFEQVYPDLVKKSEIDNKRVNYIELIPLLVSKIQLLQNEINELKDQLGIKIFV